jgi:nitric oxide reductase NorD protein
MARDDSETTHDLDARGSEPTSPERHSFLELTRSIASLPLDQAAAALETSAAIAAISLRAGIEFLRAAPNATHVLASAELREWGEMGRRIAMSDFEAAVAFFNHGVEEFRDIPQNLQASLFQLCLRQMSLSSVVGRETFHSFPTIFKAIDERVPIDSVLSVATEIARRSAKHSAEFLHATEHVSESLTRFDDDVIAKAFDLAGAFAARAGGIAADAWSSLPHALALLDVNDAKRLLNRTIEFLERGGGAALHVLISGGEILRRAPQIFDDWIELLWVVAAHGNASLIAFVRSTPAFVRILGAEGGVHEGSINLSRRVLSLTKEIAAVDGEAALSAFRSSAKALHSVSIDQFEAWARRGLSTGRSDARTRRSYFSLETRGSYEALHSGSTGLSLESVQHLLRLYVEALTGSEVEVAALAAIPDESRIGDGRTIHLPALVNEFGDEEFDFRLYKVLAAHGAGQIEFGTYETGAARLGGAFRAIAETYATQNRDALDAFSIADEMVASANVPPASSEQKLRHPSSDLDYRAVLRLFPQTQLARRIFGTLENGRIDRQLRRKYRGLSRDLDLVREYLSRNRPKIAELPATLVPFELLFQITLLGGALEDSRQYYSQIVSELEAIAGDYLATPTATVADTLMATSRVYSLFQSITPNDDALQQVEVPEEPSDDTDETMATDRMQQPQTERMPPRKDARELFNAWNDPSAEGEPDELAGAEAWSEAEAPEQVLEEGEVAYNYDEWDRELTDHRLGWCRVIEKRVKHGDRHFVDQTKARYKGVISSIRHQFQLMKPENLIRVANEVDGEEFDLNAVIDYVIDRRADGHQSERIYTKRLRRKRDVAVSFLLDQSSSTARTIGRHPLQPYTRPGRRIIEIEKEGLVLMSEALEAVGDVYAITGFTSEGRRNVKFYVVKDFGEKYSDEVKRRIGGINYQNNTRLGAAIRHATAKLAKQDARTRLLIVLSDGRPYDHDYGDARYAREDTREALRQAKNEGITPFCITIDRESEAELKDLYGEIGYTIIDDVLSLPERLPGIYRRLTT